MFLKRGGNVVGGVSVRCPAFPVRHSLLATAEGCASCFRVLLSRRLKAPQRTGEWRVVEGVSVRCAAFRLLVVVVRGATSGQA